MSQTLDPRSALGIYPECCTSAPRSPKIKGETATSEGVGEASSTDGILALVSSVQTNYWQGLSRISFEAFTPPSLGCLLWLSVIRDPGCEDA